MKVIEEIEIKELKRVCRSLNETGFLENKIHCQGKAKGIDIYVEFMMAVEGLTEEQQCKLPDDVVEFYNSSVSDEVADDGNTCTQKFEQNYIEPQQRNLFQIVENAESTKDVTEPTKKCPRCKKYKGYSQFNKNASLRDGMQTYCRECQSKAHSNWYQRNPSKKKKNLRSNIKLKQPPKNLNKISPNNPTLSKEDLLYIEALSILINYNATKFERRGAVEILKDIELHRNGNKPPEITIENLQQFCKKEDTVEKEVFPFWANTIGETIAFIEKGGIA